MKEKYKKVWDLFVRIPKKYKLLAVGVTAVIVFSMIINSVFNKDTEAVTYRETTVEFGSLVVGVEESSTVDIGTVEQIFELDMSALKRVETGSSFGSGMSMGGSMGGTMGGGMPGGMTGSSSSGGMGGNDMFSQMFNMAGGNSTNTTSSAAKLEIAEVCISVGQQVEEGDVLYRLEENGVAELASDLESNVTKAKADLDALKAEQALSRVTAENTYQTSLAYGSYAEIEKNNSLTTLKQTVTEKEAELKKAQENAAAFTAQLEQMRYDYNLAKENLDNCTWSYEYTDKDDVYALTYYFDLMKQAASLESSLSQSLETLEKNIEQAQSNVEACERELAKAKRSLTEGTLSAEETYELRMLAYNNAQETYDITLAYLEDSLAEQEQVYAEASEKWEEFSSHIDGVEVRANYSGIITSVDLAEGDALTTGATIVTLYDASEVSMTVSLDEEDMADIAKGSMANISFTAYPEDIYKAVVSEVSDASSDSSGATTYEVTVTLQGDVSGLFQGMTGDITFITKEMKEVTYVSNRAVSRKGNKSYVKIKNANGNIKTQEVVTGFSDGVNVEIVEGLAVGDVVLIESKVAGE